MNPKSLPQELKEIWAHWDGEIKQLFYHNYVDLSYLLNVKVDKHLFRAITQFWNPAYSCFTFGNVDLVHTVEEYTTLLHCPGVQADKAYSRATNVSTFVKKLMNITGMSEQWFTAQTQQKGDAKTFRSLNACQRAAWFHSHFWKVDKVSYWVFSENYSLLKEIVATPRSHDISEENWMAILQNFQEEDVEWRALWMVPDEILYRCGSFDWVPLFGIWGAIGYASLLVLRQYRSRQFIPVTHGLAQHEFSYKGDNYKKKVQEISNAWN
ncbi:hypothetical protein J1N35_036789 [Gossypium stocksii]|uniref:DUF7745 domain-containing protein n=1 Tax=Gossypium stocksii TaxID=47602 RepID=A0A9D3UJD4_9ROSI|nr:hypothetical protein J1N35_036789 [Gossypium stocksii]